MRPGIQIPDVAIAIGISHATSHLEDTPPTQHTIAMPGVERLKAGNEHFDDVQSGLAD
jgi:hypothetical protein